MGFLVEIAAFSPLRRDWNTFIFKKNTPNNAQECILGSSGAG